MTPGLCFFGRFEAKRDARALKAQLTMLMPHVVNSKSKHVPPLGDDCRKISGGETFAPRPWPGSISAH
jgi:hypothetical protein